MNVPSFIKRLFLILLIYPTISSCQTKQKKQTPYNVLFIAVDDLRTELNCYGATHIKSPNIDRLAGSGVRFTNAHVQQAICMASRASIMSGIRPEKQGIYTGESVTDLLPNVLTMNKFFAQNGYEIASSGKIYHYTEDTKAQFGDTYIEPNPTWEAKGYVTEEGSEALKLTKKPGNGLPYEAAQVHDTIYPDGINTLNAMRKLEVLKKEGKPFFMAVGLIKPHLPFNAPQKYWDMYPKSSVGLSKLTERPENSSNYTMRYGGELGNYYGMPKLFEDVPDSTAISLRRGYYACVSYVDAQVGNLMNKLDELGLRENTIVVLWGDHGYKLGDYGSWCKWSNMNIDTNIPFIFNVPNGKKGQVYTHPVEALDIYPTLAELCQLKQPSHLEGKSLVPILKNPKKESKTKSYAYSIWPDNRWNYDKTVMGYSVTDDQFNYVEWVQLNTGEVLERELYDHAKDPKETKNVIAESQYHNVISELAKKVKEKKEATDHNHNFKKLK
ncbi:iduronate 2-sulfatase [Lutibacter agarilyticus]|uniref:Iduronate 2-sulfatase n=1 Tax=Lutibacter agarilyticus TaxID=1109740 RepID=A0A238Y4F0_9FLAO|nr:sulfatase [Lutibacter agarilyticus]SNR65910.1 iduronate 2-sulfatase [Lutibacter agarilyticus]